MRSRKLPNDAADATPLTFCFVAVVCRNFWAAFLRALGVAFSPGDVQGVQGGAGGSVGCGGDGVQRRRRRDLGRGHGADRVVTDSGEGFLVRGDLGAVPAAEGAGCGGAAAQGRGGAGADQLGGGLTDRQAWPRPRIATA